MGDHKLFGLFAHPAHHSMSPLMHNEAFKHVGLEYHYHAFDVHPEHLQTAMKTIKALGLGGVNVSIPHKEGVIPFLDDIDEEARVIGAVNTIVLEKNGCLKGYNTDGAGYVQSLMTETNVDLPSANILILGAGGAAKGIGVYLLKHGCRRLTIANRTFSRAEELMKQLQEYMVNQQLEAEVHCIAWEQIESDSLFYTVIINTTPTGMWPNIEETPLHIYQLPAGTIVSDIVYNPLKTRFLQEAEAQGATIHQGLGMFVYQGALAFEYFTGYKAPLEIMRNTVFQRLQQGG